MSQFKANTFKKIASFFLFLLIIGMIEWLGHHFTLFSVKGWYLSLQKPSWTPPRYVFAPVWTILYLMIAIAGLRVYWKKAFPNEKKRALILYGFQLILNLFWPFFFFFLKNPFFALLDIFLLLILIGWIVQLFYRLDRIASFLFIPYFLWTFYAMMLNFAIWILNPSL